jgi:hypothetical protein
LYVVDSKLFPNNSKQRAEVFGVFYRQSNRQTALQDRLLGSLPVQIETVMMRPALNDVPELFWTKPLIAVRVQGPPVDPGDRTADNLSVMVLKLKSHLPISEGLPGAGAQRKGFNGHAINL